ncbi:MAG: signal recognition particle protein [Devosiaceae bacterium]|nr:signal recognition particle protein [Devosiaceae bacterium]
MFDNLSDRLGNIFKTLTSRGALSEADIKTAMREVRRALIEADVSLEVVRAFITQVSERAVGAEVTKSITPGQQIIKIVHDELVQVLGEEAVPISLKATPPVAIFMVGLQGSGKTTTTAKIAKRFKERENKKILLASLDTRRPAAQEQLKILAEQVGVDSLEIIANQDPIKIAKRAMKEAKLGGYDILFLDSAGRTHIDEELMAETAKIKEITNPHETLLVVDALTGQDAINLARSFDERVDITGIVLTRIDGDGRGGAALSMRAATGKPIKLMGVGEKLDALEDFHPSRIADRILGKGDIVSLVEKASQNVSVQDAEKMAKKLKKGIFDLNDLKGQLEQMKKMGGMGKMLGLMPGMGKMKKAISGANLEDKIFDRQVAIINSMTKKERELPALLNASRRKRIAKGSGTEVSEINKLMKQHRQMADMMKKMSKGGGKGGGMGALSSMFGGGMPKGMGAPDMGAMPNMDATQLERMAREMGLDPSAAMGGSAAMGENAAMAEELPQETKQIEQQKSISPPTLPGLGSGSNKPRFPNLPGLGGSNPFNKK